MEDSLEEALRLKAKELRDTLSELKKQDFDINVNKLKSNLPLMRRCMICTLKLPCKHFRNLKEMPRKKTTLSSPEDTKKPIEETIDFSKFIPNFPPETKKIGFKVNYRGKERMYYIDPHVRTTSLPNEKRFNLLLTIEAYREEKLQEKMNKLENARKEEEKSLREKYLESELKKKYLEKQKEKVKKHREELSVRREQLKKFIEDENEKQQKKEQKLQDHYERQKKQLLDHYEKKKATHKSFDNREIRDLDNLTSTL